MNADAPDAMESRQRDFGEICGLLFGDPAGIPQEDGLVPFHRIRNEPVAARRPFLIEALPEERLLGDEAVQTDSVRPPVPEIRSVGRWIGLGLSAAVGVVSAAVAGTVLSNSENHSEAAAREDILTEAEALRNLVADPSVGPVIRVTGMEAVR